MAREYATYRLHLEALSERFGQAAFISRSQAAEYLGVSTQTLDKMKIPHRNGKYTRVGLAHWLAEGDK